MTQQAHTPQVGLGRTAGCGAEAGMALALLTFWLLLPLGVYVVAGTLASWFVNRRLAA